MSTIPDNIREVRAAIDAADEIMLKALASRMKAVGFLKEMKKKENLPTEDTKREEEVKAKWKKHAKELKVSEELALLMLDFILSESKRIQSA